MAQRIELPCPLSYIESDLPAGMTIAEISVSGHPGGAPRGAFGFESLVETTVNGACPSAVGPVLLDRSMIKRPAGRRRSRGV